MDSSFGPVSSYELVPLAGGVFAWLPDSPSHSHPNSGIVVAEDGLTIIDAGLCPSLSDPLAQQLSELTPLPIKRLVATGSHIDVVGGSKSFPLAAVYGSAQTSAHLDQEPNRSVWQALHPTYGGELAEVDTRPVTHTVAEPAHLCPASIAIPIGGPQFENLAIQVPGANVVFTGLLASFGAIPLGFEADFPAWISSLDQVAGHGEIFVPSHGPIGGVEELVELRHYLEACVDANGVVSDMKDGPWRDWQNQQFTPVNVERAHLLSQGDPSPPPSMLSLLGMA